MWNDCIEMDLTILKKEKEKMNAEPCTQQQIAIKRNNEAVLQLSVGDFSEAIENLAFALNVYKQSMGEELPSSRRNSLRLAWINAWHFATRSTPKIYKENTIAMFIKMVSTFHRTFHVITIQM